MNASSLFQNCRFRSARRWVVGLLVAAALAVPAIGLWTDDAPTAWDDVPILAGGDEESIGGG